MSIPPGEITGIGAIGYGDHWDWSHEPFFQDIPGCEIVAVADTKPARRDLARARLGLPEESVTKDYHDLLENDAVDAVAIATDDKTHFQIAVAALRAGKHTFLEKPAAANLQELAALPGLFEYAERRPVPLRFWICHAREFGDDGVWGKTAQFIGNPALISEVFGVGPMGKLLELRYDCHYTVPTPGKNLHATFADDKLSHTIVGVLRGLPQVAGFRDALLLYNDETSYDARLVTISTAKNKANDGVVVRAAGRRTAHHANHNNEDVYRDWAEVIFQEGVLYVEPSAGEITLKYGNKLTRPLPFNPDRLYDDMFSALNREFVACVRDPDLPEPIPARVKILGTAAALLMQQPGFDGLVTEEAVRNIGRQGV